MTAGKQISFIDLAAQSAKLKTTVEDAINGVITHGQFVMGPEVAALEQALSSYLGCSHAVTCSSGTDALLISLMALDIQPGDAVFTTPFSFIATAEAVALLGAVPVFVDIDETTFNIDPGKLDIAVSQWIKTGKGRAKCIVAVDIFGLPADYEQINRVAGTYNLAVIQDGAQSFGGEQNRKKTGNLAGLGTTSFFPSKPLGSYGDGGAVFTNSAEMAETLASIRVHGRGDNKYDNIRLGINGRLDTIQAAVLLEKLKIFDWELSQRRKLADLYRKKLGDSVQCQAEPRGCCSAWALFSFVSDRRTDIMAALAGQGIPYAIYYPTPLHLQKVFSGLNHCPGDFPVSESLCGKILSIPFHPYLGTEAAVLISDVILAALDKKENQF